ncbi:MAG: hypothetical protein ACOY5U_02320 [Pseudomonadota bacterium]
MNRKTEQAIDQGNRRPGGEKISINSAGPRQPKLPDNSVGPRQPSPSPGTKPPPEK